MNTINTQDNSWAFFDFDDTLLEGDSILYWRQYFYKKQPLKRFYQILDVIGLILHSLRIIKTSTLKRILFIPAANTPISELNVLAEDFVRVQLVPRLYPEMVERMWAHHRLGHYILIISASSRFYLKFLVNYFPPCTIMGTEWDFRSFKGVKVPFYRNNMGNLKGENKIVHIRTQGQLPRSGENCFAYSDNIVDRFLLAYTRYPSVINPDRLLEQMAEKNNWPILRIGKPTSRFWMGVFKFTALFFALPVRDREDETLLNLKKQWSIPGKFPITGFSDIKERVERLDPELSLPEIHQFLFKGFPTLKTFLEKIGGYSSSEYFFKQAEENWVVDKLI